MFASASPVLTSCQICPDVFVYLQMLKSSVQAKDFICSWLAQIKYIDQRDLLFIISFFEHQNDNLHCE